MNKTVGFILAAIGQVLFLFFLNYDAELMPVRIPGIIASLLVLITGVYILVKQKKPAPKTIKSPDQIS